MVKKLVHQFMEQMQSQIDAKVEEVEEQKKKVTIVTNILPLF